MTNKSLHSTFYILHSKHSTSAFTLMEMLISISVFMVFVGLVAGSYISLVKANNTANDMQKLYRETRNVFDVIASEIKNGAIDYSCVNPETDVHCIENQNAGEKGEKKVLGILRRTGASRALFKLKDGKILFQEQTRDPTNMAWVYVTDWQPLTAEKSNVEDLRFKIFPEKNPYDAANAENDASQWQPSTTIFLKINGRNFKTTYSSRTYGR
ncbi:hypothetical protein HZC21_01215 [Candidatus Peregrinibacteria bacterium]|nr:hypothetical protein [Candidatus Peregrinibacteria bacterium]